MYSALSYLMVYVIISCDLTSGLGTTDLPIDDPSILHKLQLIVIENGGEVMHFRHYHC